MPKRIASGVLVAVMVAALAAGCSANPPATSSSDLDTPSVLPADTSAAPFVYTMSDGEEFHLADRIIQKVQDGEPLNFVYSISDAGQPVFSDAIKSGFEDGVATASAEVGYSITPRFIGPVGGGNEQQVAEIRSLLNADQIDALVFNAAQPGPFVDILNEVMADGVPVWGTGGDSPDSNRVGFFSLDEVEAGKAAGEAVAAWADANDVKVTKAALFTGDPAGPWAQNRMKGFVEGLSEGIPGVEFVNSPEDPFNTTFDFPAVYADATAFINGNPDVQVLFHTDQGVQMLGNAIADAGMTGQVWAAGFNLSPQILDYIASDDIVATVGQNWHGQAATAAEAAAQFIFKGVVIDGVNAADPYVVTKDNVDEARDVLANNGA